MRKKKHALRSALIYIERARSSYVLEAPNTCIKDYLFLGFLRRPVICGDQERLLTDAGAGAGGTGENGARAYG